MNLNPISHLMNYGDEDTSSESSSTESDDESSEDDGKPCSETGHNYEFDSIYGYFTRNQSRIRNPDKQFLFYKKEVWICTKCDSYDFRKVDIGTVEVDGETDELEVIDQAE